MAMSNNFKDDFEKNRQSIDTNSHQDHTEDVEKDQSELEHQDTIENTEQQFPPRNAQRRKKKKKNGFSPIIDRLPSTIFTRTS